MCFRNGKPCKNKLSTSVFEGFAQWVWNHENQQKYLKKYINILSNLMTNPCTINGRKSNAENRQNKVNMDPKWIKIHQKCMKERCNKASRKMMQKWSAPKLSARSGHWARRAERGKEFLQSFQVKVPSCMQHLHTNKHSANN